ncbi:MAG: 6-phosphogluconolactonase [Anaerolineales bacterium]
MNIRVYADALALARGAAQHVMMWEAAALAERDRFVIALAGGSTPRQTYTLLATDAFAEQLDWERIHVFWGDERCVPPTHPESNYRMARETLLDHVPIPAPHVHRIPGELGPEEAAATYARELRALFGADPIRFDVILLGLGRDGHTASLFPGTEALQMDDRPVAANYAPRLESWRITLTLPVINAARHVGFIVSGEHKAETLARVQAGSPLPAARVRPDPGQLVWLVDEAAASKLPET